MSWIVFTMDRTVGIAHTKRQALDLVMPLCVVGPIVRRLRKGAYEYRTYTPGAERAHTYYVMTEEEAKHDGWTGWQGRTQ